MVVYTRDNGKTTYVMVKVLKSIEMEADTKGNISIRSLKELAHIFGQMEKYMKENLQMDLNTVLGYEEAKKAICILVNGSMGRPMDLAFILGGTEIHMKVNLNHV